MIDALWRKAAQVANDPVLRRWLIARMLHRETQPARFVPNVPPYLGDIPPPNGVRATIAPGIGDIPEGAPEAPIELPLPGARVRLSPGEEDALFERKFDDLETSLAIHRFAWLPLLGHAAPPSWVDALWRAWTERYARPDHGWAWHPYTAAERAINLLDFAGRSGLPGPRDRTLETLAAHGPAIAERLEYFGEHYTSNHLSNNGRGLFRLGLALGMPVYADLGGRILVEEADRIFHPSGVLREGSTHYHSLVTRNYVDAWLAARAHGRPETDRLEDIAARAVAAGHHLVLPGGMPLIGDISPDCPPEFLAGLGSLKAGDGGWTGLLSPSAAETYQGLAARAVSANAKELGRDGWWRIVSGDWSSLWHVEPAGWPAMPGHAHQDMGSFELHFGTTPIFVDPGRGIYGDEGEAIVDVAGTRHNGLTVDGANPYPRNRPYYSDGFRRSVCGDAPAVEATGNALSLRHDGFSRLKNVGQATRRLEIGGATMRLTDRIEGKGRRRIARRFHTTHHVVPAEGGVSIQDSNRRFELRAEGDFNLFPSKRWVAYGESAAATTIEIANDVRLPFETALTVEVV